MKRLFYVIVILLLLSACGKKNKMVLDQDEMASLMADIHIAEAVIDLNRNKFEDDSSKMVLKQSIYAAHNVTSEQVDSSYKWYGYHIEDYMKVYDKTIKLLNERQEALLSASTRQVVMDGDSVDIWPSAKRYEFSRLTPSRLITFSIPVDSNWHNNDVFTLHFNMVTSHNPVTARMTVEYADGTSAYNIAAGRNQGDADVSIKVDSTLSPLRIAGYILTYPDDKEVVRLDSISLCRLRSHLVHRYVSQRPFNYGIKAKPKVENSDTIATVDTLSVTFTSQNNANASQGIRHNTDDRTKTASRANRHSSAQPRQAVNVTKNQFAPKSSGGSAAQEGIRKRDEMLRAARNRK